MLDDLRHRPARERDDRRAARERFDHHHAERLRPIDGKEERARAAEELLFAGLADLADELDERIGEERRDVSLEIRAVGVADFRGDA